MEPLSTSSSQPASFLAGRVIPASLLLVFVLQCVWFIRTQSFTFDEPVHIAEGLDAWRHGRFEQYNDHPPLARLLCALPLVNAKWQVEIEQLPGSFYVRRVAPDPISMAWRARLMNVPLGIVLGLLVWLETRRSYSTWAANFALGLFAFLPSLIAHFSLATTDGAATLLIFTAAIQVRREQKNQSWGTTALTGVVLGLMLLAKFSTVPMFALALGWLLLLKGGGVTLHPWKWNWRRCATVTAIALVVLWAGYFFHVSRLTIRDGVLTASHPNWKSTLVKPTRSKLNLSVPVPAGEYIAGFRDLVFHNAHGQRAFFLGEVSPTGGWKTYYAVAILLKWPSLFLAATLVGLIFCTRARVLGGRGLLVLLSFPALYFGLAIFSHFNIGERHILPLYPFALVLAGAAADWLLRRRLGMQLACGLLLLNAVDALRYAPGYLSYMNALVNPATSYRLLSDSNLDWGQGLIALREYQEQHPGEQISLAYFGSVDPGSYGITARKLDEQDRVSGTVAVSATQLSGQYLQDPAAYHWLLRRKPTTILDHSIYLYKPER